MCVSISGPLLQACNAVHFHLVLPSLHVIKLSVIQNCLSVRVVGLRAITVTSGARISINLGYSAVHGFWPVEFSNGRLGAS